MATVIPPEPTTAKSLVTAEQYAERHDLDDVPTELVRGVIVFMSRPQQFHGSCCVAVAVLLHAWRAANGDRLRVLSNDTGFVTARGPDTVRGPDVMAFKASRLPDGKLQYGWAENLPPDLCVEVRSPTNSWTELTEKAAEYLAVGVPLVWLVDPEARRVHAFRPDAAPEILAEVDPLDARELLPGFAARVADIFEAI